MKHFSPGVALSYPAVPIRCNKAFTCSRCRITCSRLPVLSNFPPGPVVPPVLALLLGIAHNPPCACSPKIYLSRPAPNLYSQSDGSLSGKTSVPRVAKLSMSPDSTIPSTAGFCLQSKINM